MNADQKRAAVSVAIVLGLALIGGMVMSLCLTGTHGVSDPVVWKVYVGIVGPFMHLYDFPMDIWPIVIGAGLLVLFGAFTVVGIVKGNRGMAILGAVDLTLLWLGCMLMACVFTNFD